MRTKRPTILQIIPDLETGGAELSTVEIADAIVKAGGRAIVLSTGGRMADRLMAVGGELIRFPAATKNPFRIIANARAISEMVGQEHIDLIHARSRAPAWSALLAARKCKIPFVTTYHGAYSEKSRIKNLYNSVMARSDVVVANSQYTADLIKSRYGTEDARLRVVYRGVDLDRFNRVAISQERCDVLRNQWDVPANSRLVVNIARLTHWKGQREIIDVAEKLCRNYPDVVFILAGDDQGRSEYRRDLEERIAEKNLTGRVKIVGHVDDVPAALSLASVAFVGSTEPEAFGRAATEAQAVGCPIISTNIGAPPETVAAPPRVDAAARTGWLVAPGNILDYESALVEALNLSGIERSELSQRAIDHVIKKFSTAVMQRHKLEIYDALLGTNLVDKFDHA